MILKQRQVPFMVKEITKSGDFSGYLSVFGNTDHHRDIVMPGAFDDSLKEWADDDALPPLLWQHDSSQPIGAFTKLVPDDTGLYAEGTLLVNDVQKAREAHALAKAKVVRGMSIGYSVNPGGEAYDGKAKANRLTSLNLLEGSMVTFPANTEAGMTDIKSAFLTGDLPTLREFESSLRDALSCSRDDAKIIAKFGFVKLLELRDADKKQIDSDESEVDSVLAAIRLFSHAIPTV